MKILYVTTISDTVNAFLIPHIKMLIDEGHKVDVAFNIEQEVKPEIFELGCKIHQLPLQRFPIRKDNLRAYKLLKNIISSEKYDLVHTHTPVASAIVRLACKKLNNVKVFYTAHGFHFYKGASLINWLVYYPVEKWLAKYTDTLITINKEDFERAKTNFKTNKIRYIPGVGIDLAKINTNEIDRNCKRSEIGLSKDSFVILSVGELNKNKNHEIIIKSLSKINNPKIHYVICGQGKLEEYLKDLSKKLKIESQVHFLGFRRDVSEICKISDLFAFPSFREGLSVALMESMANGLPVICSDIRGNSDLIQDGKNGYLVEPNDIDGFAKRIIELIEDSELRSGFGRFNIDIVEKFSINHVLSDMRKILAEINLVEISR